MLSPIAIATLQAGFLNSISNLLAQLISAHQGSKPFSLDLLQLIRFVALALITAPPNYKWQQYLERRFPAYLPGHRPPTTQDIEMQEVKRKSSELKREDIAKPKLNWRNTMTKWFLDCISVGAFFNTIAFLALMGIMKGQSSSQIGDIVRNETLPLMIAGYKVWPIASIISFTCVPVERRIVFASLVGLLWGIYLSLVAVRV